jgi:hypothetical protein
MILSREAAYITCTAPPERAVGVAEAGEALVVPQAEPSIQRHRQRARKIPAAGRGPEGQEKSSIDPLLYSLNIHILSI